MNLFGNYIDPITNCSYFKNEGCTHVDGYLCKVQSCEILNNYEKGVYEMEKIKQGSWVRDGNGEPWIKIEDDEEHHVEDMFANLFTGRVRHLSRLEKPVKLTSHDEIVW